MPNPVISQITLPSGTTYDIKDAVARSQVAGAITIRGETTTALTDNATTNPIMINGSSYTAISNDAVFYSHKEFVFDGTNWHEFGDMSGLGTLAYKNSASGTYTPAGTVSQPTFTGSALNSTGNFTPSGTISVNESTGSGTSYKPEGTLSLSDSNDTGKTGYTPSGTINVNSSTGSGTSYTPEGFIAINASSGEGTSYTPEGTLSLSNSSGTGKMEYTPDGTISAPSISLKTAGSTASVTPFGSAGTLPSLTMSVSNENLSISFDQGTLPSGGTAVTVKTGDGAYQAVAPTFSGKTKYISFNGEEKKIAFSGTTKKLAFSGNTKYFGFSGTAKKLAFTGTQGSVSVSGTPSGTVSQPTFTGTQDTITVS